MSEHWEQSAESVSGRKEPKRERELYMDSLGRGHATADSRLANGQRAERCSDRRQEEVEKRRGEMFPSKWRPRALLLYRLGVAGFSDGAG